MKQTVSLTSLYYLIPSINYLTRSSNFFRFLIISYIVESSMCYKHPVYHAQIGKSFPLGIWFETMGASNCCHDQNQIQWTWLFLLMKIRDFLADTNPKILKFYLILLFAQKNHLLPPITMQQTIIQSEFVRLRYNPKRGNRTKPPNYKCMYKITI